MSSVPDNCLLAPGERTVNYIFVGKVAQRAMFIFSLPNRFTIARGVNNVH